MTLREFWRFHFLKALLGLVVIQLVIIALIQNYNHKPIAARDEFVMIENTELKIKALNNDTDKDENSKLELLNLGQPLNGTITNSGNLLFYKPHKQFVGLDSLWYTITDGKKESNLAYIKIQVNENLPPMAVSDEAMAYAGNKLKIDALDNDFDQEGDSIFIKKFTQAVYGKIEQMGSSFIYASSNNLALADSFQYSLSDGYHASEKVWVYIKVKDKKAPCYPWLSTDVGNTALEGSSLFKGGKFIIKASGSDIWDNRDGFNFTYQYVNGDCEIVTRVDSLEDTNEWAKAGVIIRESLKGGSKNAFLGMSSKHGACFQQRAASNSSSDGFGGIVDASIPYWVKLVRKGNEYTALVSADGKKWNEISSTTVEMPENVFVGLCVTSHDNNKICRAVLSNFSLKGKIAKF